jgi:hypothetical protein
MIKMTVEMRDDLCIELWTFLAKTGMGKGDWPRITEFTGLVFDCFFCEWTMQQGNESITCPICPIQASGPHAYNCLNVESYYLWEHAESDEERAKPAKEFLKYIKTITKKKPAPSH